MHVDHLNKDDYGWIVSLTCAFVFNANRLFHRSSGVLKFTPGGLDDYSKLIQDTKSALADQLATLERRIEAAENSQQEEEEVEVGRGGRDQ